jgi:hypothetical protein
MPNGENIPVQNGIFLASGAPVPTPISKPRPGLHGLVFVDGKSADVSIEVVTGREIFALRCPAPNYLFPKKTMTLAGPDGPVDVENACLVWTGVCSCVRVLRGGAVLLA